MLYIQHYITRSQAVGRADRTASQQTIVISDCCHFLLVVLWNQASVSILSNGFRDIQWRM